MLSPRKWFLMLLVVAMVLPLSAYAQEPGSSPTSHTVVAGENLFRIALTYGLSTDQLAAANNISNTALVYVGQVLVIPGANAPTVPAESAPVTPAETAPVDTAATQPTTTTPQTHVVQRGETLASIARQYGLTWDQLAIANGVANPNHIVVGQQLNINGSVPPAPAEVVSAPPAEVVPPPAESAPTEAAATVPAATNANGQVIHIVQRNEGLATIARAYGVNWMAVAQANNIASPNLIYPGQELIIPDPTATPPAGYGTNASATAPVQNGRWILVELSKQQISAYENGVLMRQVTVSTGLPGTPTVTGDYYVYTKLPSQTMSGPGYYLPGVPWVMYFYQGYAIHGTYWHSNFGQPMSHGCVNLPTSEAEWFFNFAQVGTPVHVQY